MTSCGVWTMIYVGCFDGAVYLCFILVVSTFFILSISLNLSNCDMLVIMFFICVLLTADCSCCESFRKRNETERSNFSKSPPPPSSVSVDSLNQYKLLLKFQHIYIRFAM